MSKQILPDTPFIYSVTATGELTNVILTAKPHVTGVFLVYAYHISDVDQNQMSDVDQNQITATFTHLEYKTFIEGIIKVLSLAGYTVQVEQKTYSDFLSTDIINQYLP